MWGHVAAFIALLDERTSPLDSLEIHECLSRDAISGLLESPAQDDLSIRAVYDILLYAPIEYLPRASRTDLLRRAMAADVSIGTSVRDAILHPGQRKRLVSLRAFICQAFAHVGTVEHNVRLSDPYVRSHLTDSFL